MRDAVITFIGCGNMGRCLIGGLIADGYPPENLRAVDSDPGQLERLNRDFPLRSGSDAGEAVKGADAVVLAVKPQSMKEVCLALARPLGSSRPLVLSIAAGIRTADLKRWLGDLPLVRAMPNTPALVQSGATALYATAKARRDQREMAEAIMRAAGLTLWLDDESLMDAVTAVSGSGPAYFFLVMEAMEAAAVKLGLPAPQARLLILQTAFGAAKMALESSVEPAALRAQVTSPGGTTERALKVLNERGLMASFEQALTEARNRSLELAKHFGEA